MQHMCAKHGAASHEPMNDTLDLEDTDVSRTPAQSFRGSSNSSSPNGIQFEGVDFPDPINFDFAKSPEPFGMFLR
jgi:hypothetical protein